VTVTVTLQVRCEPGYIVDYPELYRTQTRGRNTTTEARHREASCGTARGGSRSPSQSTSARVSVQVGPGRGNRRRTGVLVWMPGVTTALREQYVTQIIWLR